MENELKYLESSRKTLEIITRQEIERAIRIEDNFEEEVCFLKDSLDDSLYELRDSISSSELDAYYKYSDDPEKLAIALDTLLSLEERVHNKTLNFHIDRFFQEELKHNAFLFSEKPEEIHPEIICPQNIYDGSGSFEEIRERLWNTIYLCLTEDVAYIQKWIKYNVLFGAKNPYTSENYWKTLNSEQFKSC